MQHIAAAVYTYAKESCYRCGQTHDLVDMDVHIEGEGSLAICRNCIREACFYLDIDLKMLEAKAASYDAMKSELEEAQADYRAARKETRALKAELKDKASANTPQRPDEK